MCCKPSQTDSLPNIVVVDRCFGSLCFSMVDGGRIKYVRNVKQ